MSLAGKDFDMLVYTFPNPKRILSATAQTDTSSIHARPCFLCQENRPQEQNFVSYKNYQILVNPLPHIQTASDNYRQKTYTTIHRPTFR